jgi:hypothetical protein
VYLVSTTVAEERSLKALALPTFSFELHQFYLCASS